MGDREEEVFRWEVFGWEVDGVVEGYISRFKYDWEGEWDDEGEVVETEWGDAGLFDEELGDIGNIWLIICEWGEGEVGVVWRGRKMWEVLCGGTGSGE